MSSWLLTLSPMFCSPMKKSLFRGFRGALCSQTINHFLATANCCVLVPHVFWRAGICQRQLGVKLSACREIRTLLCNVSQRSLDPGVMETSCFASSGVAASLKGLESSSLICFCTCFLSHVKVSFSSLELNKQLGISLFSASCDLISWLMFN